jgi:hypothetical protein
MPKQDADPAIYDSGESWDQASAGAQVEPEALQALLASIQDSQDEEEARRFNGGELPEGYVPPSKRPRPYRPAFESEHGQARRDRRERNRAAHALRQAEAHELARMAREARRAGNRAAFAKRKR